MSLNTPDEYRENKEYLDYLIRYSKYTDFHVQDEIRILAKYIEDYEKIHYPITDIDPTLLERSERRWEHECDGGGRVFKPNGESSMPEYRYYIFNPNNGVFVGGPYACKTWARVCMAEKQPKAGVPEMEPYIVVELLKDDIMLHKVDYRKKNV